MANSLTKAFSQAGAFVGKAASAFNGAFSNTFRFPMAGGSGYGGDGQWLQRLLPGSRFDYKAEAGNLWENSIVLICLKWQARVFPEAPFCVKRALEDGKGGTQYEIVPGHPLTKVIKRPNAFYTGSVLWQATLLSLAVDGNAYWFAELTASKKIIRLWWIPHWMITPIWKFDGTDYLTGYRYRVNGEDLYYSNEQIIHFRDGLHPLNPRKGLGCLSAELRHVCTDNERATYTAAIVRNMGVPGVVIRPPKSKVGEQRTSIGETAATMLRELWKEKFGGENRGEPVVLNMPLEITPVGFSPKDLAIDIMAKIPEERICAAMGIPPVVAGLGAGLSQASAKASHANSLRQAYESNIIPTQRLLCEDMDLQCLPLMGDEDHEVCAFDLSGVVYLQEDQDELGKRVIGLYQGGVLRRSEARTKIGYESDAEDEIYYTDIAGAPEADPLNAGG